MWLTATYTERSRHLRCSFKKGVLKTCAKSQENTSAFATKYDPRPATLFNKRLRHKIFYLNFVIF